MANRPTSNYPCKQLELYSVLRIGLSNYRDKQTDLALFKAKYTTIWGDDFEAEINAVAALPDYQTRDETTESLGILLSAKAINCGNKWQDLKRYIADVAGWEDLQKPKLEAAGSNLYPSATHGNWPFMSGLMQTAENFISNNLSQLTANDNMPPAFQGEFTVLTTEFEALYAQLTDGFQDNAELTDEKVGESNRLHKKLMVMFLDAQAIFRSEAATQERFVFAHVLSIIRGSSGVTKTININPESFEHVKRVVKNSKITNTGTVTLWIEKGIVTSQGATALELLPESDLPVPDNNSELTIFNQDLTVSGQCTVRITID
jgi:hypothetical protein